MTLLLSQFNILLLLFLLFFSSLHSILRIKRIITPIVTKKIELFVIYIVICYIYCCFVGDTFP